MPLIICPNCGEDTLTLTGWAAADHCPYCGEPLATRRADAPPVRRFEVVDLNPPRATVVRSVRDR